MGEGKYGEPWVKSCMYGRYKEQNIRDRAGRLIEVDIDPDRVDRIVACVNAFSGVDDPEAFMAAVREVMTWEVSPLGRFVGESAREFYNALSALHKLMPAAAKGD